MISVQSKALKIHAERLKRKFTYEMKNSNDGNWGQKEEKNHLLILQEQMIKIILKISTLKISVRLNIHWLREEHDKDLNAAKENGTTETIEELDKLCHILEDKKVMLLKLVSNETCLRKNLRHCNIVLVNRERFRNHPSTTERF